MQDIAKELNAWRLRPKIPTKAEKTAMSQVVRAAVSELMEMLIPMKQPTCPRRNDQSSPGQTPQRTRSYQAQS